MSQDTDKKYPDDTEEDMILEMLRKLVKEKRQKEQGKQLHYIVG